MIKDYCEYGKLTFYIAHNIPVTFIRAPKKKKKEKKKENLKIRPRAACGLRAAS